MPTYDTDGLTPDYINNVRVETTSDNVFIDFGFADPFLNKGDEYNALILSRIVMNRSTFQNFVKHLTDVSNKAQTTNPPAEGAGPVILSRCPSPK